MSVALKAATDIFKFRKTGKIDIKQKFQSDFDLTGNKLNPQKSPPKYKKRGNTHAECAPNPLQKTPKKSVYSN